MPIGINDLDFDDDDYVNTLENEGDSTSQNIDEDGDPVKGWIDSPYEEEDPIDYDNNNHQDYNNSQDSLILDLLRSNGITDLDKIKFENENGEIEEVSWNSLDKETQLNILRNNEPEPERDLDEAEIQLINQLRSNKMTPEEFIQAVKQMGVAEYTKNLVEDPKYSVDELTDDELFISDLQTRIEDLTDEEISAALDHAKSNESLYAKQIKGLREEYKRLEDEKNQREAMRRQADEEERFNQFSSAVNEAITRLDSIGGLNISLDDEDVRVLNDFIFSVDDTGVSWLGKALNDPDTLVRMSWFALHGDDIFDNLTEYVNNQIKLAEQAGYEKGLKEAKPQPQARVVFNNSNNKSQNRAVRTINDLD